MGVFIDVCISSAAAHSFYKAGAKLILCARREGELNRVKKDLLELKLVWNLHTCVLLSISGNGQLLCLAVIFPQSEPVVEPHVLVMDLSDAASLEARAQEAVTFHGRIDVLINNGGISFRGEISETDIEVDRRVMEVNYFGQIGLTKGKSGLGLDKRF